MTESHRRRRSLTHVGGAIETAGDSADAKALAYALEVPVSFGTDFGEPKGKTSGPTEPETDPARAHVHGFHTYPARMHPLTAARLGEAFCPPGGRILDPFCGSGTVLVEAMIQGKTALGVDLNPLAVLLASRKTLARTPESLEALPNEAKDCAAFADQRRKARAKPTRRYPREDALLFEPHVLMELDSLRGAIHERRKNPNGPDLALVLSSILVKCSNRIGDTSTNTTPRKLAPGFPSRLFVKKTQEWVARLAEFTALLPSQKPPESKILLGDATKLPDLPFHPVDAMVTSPPYAATYDYIEHHAMRLRWLGMDAAPFQRGELGSRSAYQRIDPRAAKRIWTKELGQFLTSAAPLLPKNGALVMVIADSSVGEIPLRADEIVAATARECGFFPSARASQPRPHFHGPGLIAFRDKPRAEHAIALRKN